MRNLHAVLRDLSKDFANFHCFLYELQAFSELG